MASISSSHSPQRQQSFQGMFSCILSLLLLTACVNAYTYRAEGNTTAMYTCNQFITRVGNDSFQMRAYSLINSNDEWFTATEVNNLCETKLSTVDIAWDILLTKYPSSVKFWIDLSADQPLTTQMNVNVLASWGDVTDDVRALCDYDGNAYFVKPSGLTATGLFFPQKVVSIMWNVGVKNLAIADEFMLQVMNMQSSGPILGEGVSITPVICQVKPASTSPSQKVWEPADNYYFVNFKIEFRHWWGLLHPEMWSELILLALIAVPKLLLVLWFLFRCRQFRDQVMTQQKYFLAVSAACFVSSVMFLLFLVGANNSGVDTCCPTPPASGFLMGLKVMSNMAFDLLVLATAKGWGVVVPKLDNTDQRKIMLYFLVTLVIFIASQVLNLSLPIAWLVILNETSIWVWIFMCLKSTKHDLSLSSRIDRHAKIEMYEKLRKLLLVGLALWMFIVTVELWVVLIIYNKEGRIVLFDIPPTLAWDLSLLLMMYGFAYVWQPSPATAQFSYTFTRQEEDGLDARDAVTDFGLEST